MPGKAEFAKMQREALETYLLKLIRAVVRDDRYFGHTSAQP